MSIQTSTENPLANAVPPRPQWGAFTAQYKRYTWGATVHLVHTKSGEVRAYSSDYTFWEHIPMKKSMTLSDIARRSTRIKNDMSPWVSHVRLKRWASDNGMHYRIWKQASDNTVEVIA